MRGVIMKKEVRKEVLSKRSSLKKEEVIQKSLSIKSKLSSLPEYINSQVRMFYISFRNEVETQDMIQESLDNGKRVIIPVVVKGDKNLLLSELKSFDELYTSTYGILEPKEEFLRPVNAQDIDIVIVPGVAFDENGYRIGYGGGYYDRLIKRLPHSCKTIAIAFEVQVIDSVPHESHDMKVDMIITEDRIINCKR